MYINDGSPNSNVYITGSLIGCNNIYTITDVSNNYSNIARVSVLEDKLKHVLNTTANDGHDFLDIQENVYVVGNIISFNNIVGISRSVIEGIPTRINTLETKTQNLSETFDVANNPYLNVNGNVFITGDISCNSFLGISKGFFGNIPTGSYRNGAIPNFTMEAFISDIYAYGDSLNDSVDFARNRADDAYDLAEGAVALSGTVAGLSTTVVTTVGVVSGVASGASTLASGVSSGLSSLSTTVVGLSTTVAELMTGYEAVSTEVETLKNIQVISKAVNQLYYL